MKTSHRVPGSRRGISPLVVLAVVVVVGFSVAAVSARAVLKEFFGSSGDSDSGHQSPPVPAAPAAPVSDEIARLQAAVEVARGRVQEAASKGDPASVQDARQKLVAAESALVVARSQRGS